jgi:mutator protein MutT
LCCAECGYVLYQSPASAALGVVLNERGEVLLVRRRLEPYRDHWALPAGYQEIDETPAETVVREVREETGVEVEVCGLLDLLFVADDPRRPANVAVFLCRAIGGWLTAGPEETHAEWFSLEALPAPIGFENSARILDRLRGVGGYPDSPWSQLKEFLARSKEWRAP